MDYFNKMDGTSGYVRASLLGFGPGLSPLHDPLRLHPSLHSQLADAAGKDGTGLLRSPLDYPHLPLLGLAHPPFLPPIHMDPRVPFGHFAPMKFPSAVTAASSLPGSAFAPLPLKVSKIEPDTPPNIFSHSMLQSVLDARSIFPAGRSPPLGPGAGDDRRDSPSPMGSHGSRESPAQAREASTPTSPGDDSRGGVRKIRPSGDFHCPVCARPLRAGEYESHLTQELENITKHIFPRCSTPSSVANSPLSNSPHLTSPLKIRGPGWETYQRVKANRQVRLRTKKRRSGRPEEDFHGLPHEESQMEHCFRRASLFGFLQQQNLPEEEEVDVEGDSSFEEYEWCGQRRVRVSSLARQQQLQQQQQQLQQQQQQQQSMQVNRIGDTESSKETLNNNSEKSRSAETESSEEKETKEKERLAASEALQKEVENLKEKVKNMERDATSLSKFNCFVCDNALTRPAVSMTCWHVFCEGCWPLSMETKSECPQCSSAFNSDDIRVIQL